MPKDLIFSVSQCLRGEFQILVLEEADISNFEAKSQKPRANG
jgi:hypothetical protein